MDELTVSSSTDSAESVETVADGKIAREADATTYTEEPDGSNSATWEHPRSERQLLEERLALAEVERDVDKLADAVTVESSDTSDEDGNDTEAGTQAAGPAWTRPEHPHFQRMAQTIAWYGPEKIAQIINPVIEAGVDVPVGVANLIATLPNSAEVLLSLARDPWCPDGLVALGEMVPAQARRVLEEWSRAVEQLAAGENTQPATRKSLAPPPIRPITDSPTRSQSDPGEMSYIEFRKYREQQIKANRRR
jgi:hypothetical protein